MVGRDGGRHPRLASLVATYSCSVLTELAYLRDQITRGVVDAAGLWRERELLYAIRDLKAAGGLDDARGLRPYLPKEAGVRNQLAASCVPGSDGVVRAAGPHRPGQAPLGSAPTYSVVDPTWGPPRG